MSSEPHVTGISFPGAGPAELARSDGWFYRLHGIVSLDMECGDWAPRVVLKITLADVSDRTLESVKAIRDSFPNHRIEIETA